MKRGISNLVLGVLLCSMLMAAAIPAYAAEAGFAEVLSREEAVYATLDGECNVKGIYVVNILNISKSGVFSDYGSYSSVKNLTSPEMLSYEAGKVSAYAPEGRFYYQGDNESTALPWNFAISYYLDDEEIKPSELAGKSGRLEISLDTNANPRSNQSFYENYLLQISVTLNTGKCSNISAPGASLANAGEDKIITFTVMPDTDGHVELSADVADFEMPGISVNAVPFSMGVDVDTSALGGELGTLENAIELLDKGVGELSDGIGQLNSGVITFLAGSSELKDGIDEINKNAGGIVGASRLILQSLRFISASVKESEGDAAMESLALLPSALTMLAEGLDEMSAGIPELSAAFATSVTALDAAFAMIPDETIDEASIQELYKSNPGNKAVSLLSDYYAAALALNAAYTNVYPVFDAVGANMELIDESIAAIASSLKEIADQAGSVGDSSDISSSIAQLSGGLSELAANYQKFQDGLEAYTNGVGQIANGYTELHAGSEGLAGGIFEIYNASVQLSDGTAELNSRTKGLSAQMDSAIEDVLAAYDKSGFIPVSFSSELNKNTVAVQFVIQTEGIVKEKVITQVESKTEAEGFWTRLKALFS